MHVLQLAHPLLGPGADVHVQAQAQREAGGHFVDRIDLVHRQRAAAVAVLAHAAAEHHGRVGLQMDAEVREGLGKRDGGNRSVQRVEPEGHHRPRRLVGILGLGEPLLGVDDETADARARLLGQRGEAGRIALVVFLQRPGARQQRMARNVEADQFLLEREHLLLGPRFAGGQIRVGHDDAGGAVAAEQVEEGGLAGGLVLADRGRIAHRGLDAGEQPAAQPAA